MGGIYIHIPFCKQACHYCDFHFSTVLKNKEAMVNTLQKEIGLRRDEFQNDIVDTIYFGGGTPSVLEIGEIEKMVSTVYETYKTANRPEITLEANPDDLPTDQIVQLSNGPVNRLSIGVQSFFDEDLKLMNRAHGANEALSAITAAKKYFDNISIDLIYGIPGADNDRWRANVEKALAFELPHISCYALTVEPRTALKKLIEKGTVPNVDDERAREQFYKLMDIMETSGHIQYEISNFGRPGYFSKNNTSYWQGKKYIGIGPSAHSFDGKHRGWNIRNNAKYIKALQAGKLPMQTETLSQKDRYNEYVMTGLRTVWGVSLKKIENDFGNTYLDHLNQQAKKYLNEHLLFVNDGKLLATNKGKFLIDGIASDLFMLNLDR